MRPDRPTPDRLDYGPPGQGGAARRPDRPGLRGRGHPADRRRHLLAGPAALGGRVPARRLRRRVALRGVQGPDRGHRRGRPRAVPRPRRRRPADPAADVPGPRAGHADGGPAPPHRADRADHRVDGGQVPQHPRRRHGGVPAGARARHRPRRPLRGRAHERVPLVPRHRRRALPRRPARQADVGEDPAAARRRRRRAGHAGRPRRPRRHGLLLAPHRRRRHLLDDHERLRGRRSPAGTSPATAPSTTASSSSRTTSRGWCCASTSSTRPTRWPGCSTTCAS